MRVVITGGAGFIGANLAREMEKSGLDVAAVDDLSTGSRANLEGLAAELHEGTVLDTDLLDKVLAGADAVVHLAARPSVPRSIQDPLGCHEANVTGTVQVLEAVRRAGVSHVVVASSSSVYGANPTMPKSEDMAVAPLSPYAVSKLATEAYTLAYHHSFGLDVLAFRFFNVFGPLQPAGHAYAAVVPAFVDAALADQPLPVYGDGSQTRDFTFVGSLARVVTDAVVRRVTSPEPVNLAFGSRTSLNELISLLEGTLGRELRRETRPPRAGDVPHSQADSRRLGALFPDVEPVSLEEGLAATVRWFESLPGHPSR